MFWRITLREISTIIDGAAARLRHQHNETAWLAWHIEALARVERLPRLTSMQQSDGRRSSPAANDCKREFSAWSTWAQSRTKGS